MQRTRSLLQYLLVGAYIIASLSASVEAFSLGASTTTTATTTTTIGASAFQRLAEAIGIRGMATAAVHVEQSPVATEETIRCDVYVQLILDVSNSIYNESRSSLQADVTMAFENFKAANPTSQLYYGITMFATRAINVAEAKQYTTAEALDKELASHLKWEVHAESISIDTCHDRAYIKATRSLAKVRTEHKAQFKDFTFAAVIFSDGNSTKCTTVGPKSTSVRNLKAQVDKTIVYLIPSTSTKVEDPVLRARTLAIATPGMAFDYKGTAVTMATDLARGIFLMCRARPFDFTAIVMLDISYSMNCAERVLESDAIVAAFEELHRTFPESSIHYVVDTFSIGSEIVTPASATVLVPAAGVHTPLPKPYAAAVFKRDVDRALAIGVHCDATGHELASWTAYKTITNGTCHSCAFDRIANQAIALRHASVIAKAAKPAIVSITLTDGGSTVGKENNTKAIGHLLTEVKSSAVLLVGEIEARSLAASRIEDLFPAWLVTKSPSLATTKARVVAMLTAVRDAEMALREPIDVSGKKLSELRGLYLDPAFGRSSSDAPKAAPKTAPAPKPTPKSASPKSGAITPSRDPLEPKSK